MSRLPWWACLATAVVTFLVLHGIASRPLPSSVRPGQISSAITGSLVHALAFVGQYLLPILCIAAAVMSFAGQRKRRALLVHVTEGGAPAAAIDGLSWQEFELLIGEAFRLQGFAVVEKGGAGPDGGVDLELMKNGERYLVQAKHWRAKQVPVEVVRELAGVMPFRRAVGAYVVTSGRFTEPAAAFAQGRGITLVNGGELQGLLVQARASLNAKDETSANAARAKAPTPVKTAAESSAPGPGSSPVCPSCDAPMKLRTASRGTNAGGSFWGCSNYPKCRGTRQT